MRQNEEHDNHPPKTLWNFGGPFFSSLQAAEFPPHNFELRLQICASLLRGRVRGCLHGGWYCWNRKCWRVHVHQLCVKNDNARKKCVVWRLATVAEGSTRSSMRGMSSREIWRVCRQAFERDMLCACMCAGRWPGKGAPGWRTSRHTCRPGRAVHKILVVVLDVSQYVVHMFCVLRWGNDERGHVSPVHRILAARYLSAEIAAACAVLSAAREFKTNA